MPRAVNWYASLALPASHFRRLLDARGADRDPRLRHVTGYLLADWLEQLDNRPARPLDMVVRALMRRACNNVRRDLRALHAAGVPNLPGTDLAVLGIFPG